jgi:hypothetical protein
VPLCHPDHARSLGLLDLPDIGRGLRLFCDAYGLDARARRTLLGTVGYRLEALCVLIRTAAEEGDAWATTVVPGGHLDLYRRDIRYLHTLRRVAGATL